jgi:hypothetical protein
MKLFAMAGGARRWISVVPGTALRICVGGCDATRAGCHDRHRFDGRIGCAGEGVAGGLGVRYTPLGIALLGKGWVFTSFRLDLFSFHVAPLF